MQENGLVDEIFKKKLTSPHEYLTHTNFQEPLNLTKDFWSTLKQKTPPDEEINCTQENIFKKFDIKNGQELTVIFKKGCFSIS